MNLLPVRWWWQKPTPESPSPPAQFTVFVLWPTGEFNQPRAFSAWEPKIEKGFTFQDHVFEPVRPWTLTQLSRGDDMRLISGDDHYLQCYQDHAYTNENGEKIQIQCQSIVFQSFGTLVPEE